jgi:hypothetical protein
MSNSNFQRQIGEYIEFNPNTSNASAKTIKIGQLNTISNSNISNNNWSGLAINSSASNDGNTEFMYIPTHTNQIIMGYNTSDYLTDAISNTDIREIQMKVDSNMYIKMTNNNFDISGENIEMSGQNLKTETIDISNLTLSNITVSNVFDISSATLSITDTLTVNGSLSGGNIEDLSNTIDDISDSLVEGGLLGRFNDLSGDINGIKDYLEIGYFNSLINAINNNSGKIRAEFGPNNAREESHYFDQNANNTNRTLHTDYEATNPNIIHYPVSSFKYFTIREANNKHIQYSEINSNNYFYLGYRNGGVTETNNGTLLSNVRFRTNNACNLILFETRGFLISSSQMVFTYVPLIYSNATISSNN